MVVFCLIIFQVSTFNWLLASLNRTCSRLVLLQTYHLRKGFLAFSLQSILLKLGSVYLIDCTVVSFSSHYLLEESQSIESLLSKFARYSVWTVSHFQRATYSNLLPAIVSKYLVYYYINILLIKHSLCQLSRNLILWLYCTASGKPGPFWPWWWYFPTGV